LRKLGSVVLVFAVTAAAAMSLSACGSSSSGKEGGTLTGSYASFPEYLDPQLAYSVEGWTALWNTYLPLLTYAHASGNAGSEVIPALATAMPKITNGGKRYTLFLRKGLKYSDGTLVKASDFPYTVERMFKLNSVGSSFFTDIAGAEKFAETKQGGIGGIKANDKTGEIQIELEKPSGTFTNELATPLVGLVPSGTPHWFREVKAPVLYLAVKVAGDGVIQ